MSQPILASFAAAVFALGAQTAFAQNKAGEDVPHPGTENFHAQCIGCHGIPGYKTAFPVVYHVPKLGGQSAAYLISALNAYKSGQRQHPSMKGVAASLSDQDIANIAAYYSSATGGH